MSSDASNAEVNNILRSKPGLGSPYHSSEGHAHDGVSLLDSGQESANSRTGEKEEAQQQNLQKTRQPRTAYLVVGSYLAAWSLAALHFAFFKLIDGKELSNAFSSRQSHLSTISLLLVTLFRAAIVATLGISFTQYFWYLLRRACLRIDLIEDLFQIRSNVFALANPKIARQTPILFMAAIVSWLVPLATIYPPTALAIRSEMYTSFANVNASIMNPSPSRETEDLVLSLLSNSTTEVAIVNGVPQFSESSSLFVTSTAEMFAQSIEAQEAFASLDYSGPAPALQSLAKLVMSTGQTMSIPPLAGENSSYSMEFYGPLIECSKLMSANTTTALGNATGVEVLVFDGVWQNETRSNSPLVLNVIYTSPLDFFAPNGLQKNGYPSPSEAIAILERRTMQCESHAAMYRVYVSYLKGAQQIRYSTDKLGIAEFKYSHVLPWRIKDHRDIAIDSYEFRNWVANYTQWGHKANVRAILDSIGSNLNYQFYREFIYGSNDKVGKHLLENGTEVDLWEIRDAAWTQDFNYTLLQDTVLNIARFGYNGSFDFDPRTSLNLSEASINALLANITISALSLNTWYGSVNVTDSEFRNVYRFAHPLNFFIPYGLCLGLTAVFISLGLYALHENGISATDGGFLQIMMTTSGDTAMRREVKEGSIGGSRNAPKELLDMRIRFGELAPEGRDASAKKHGFGTAEETKPLRKRR